GWGGPGKDHKHGRDRGGDPAPRERRAKHEADRGGERCEEPEGSVDREKGPAPSLQHHPEREQAHAGWSARRPDEPTQRSSRSGQVVGEEDRTVHGELLRERRERNDQGERRGEETHRERGPVVGDEPAASRWFRRKGSPAREMRVPRDPEGGQGVT